MPGRGAGDVRVDERDTMFARMARVPGTEAYRDTYARRPELRRVDDRIRSLPPLLDPRGRYHDPELCRNNILVADRHGSRVRIGAVTTDCPVRWDEPVDLGVRAFCGFCRKCARSCPSRALSLGEPEIIRGVSKWGTKVERCYAFWRRAGTDCGICMAVCPFSHRDNVFHNLVRRLVRLHPLPARLLYHLDEIFYPAPRRAPPRAPAPGGAAGPPGGRSG